MKNVLALAAVLTLLLAGCAGQQLYVPPTDGQTATIILDGEGAIPNYSFFTNEECRDPKRVPPDPSGKASFKVRSGEPLSVVWLYSMTKSAESGKNSWCEVAYTFWPEAKTYRLTVQRNADKCFVQVSDTTAKQTDMKTLRFVKKAYSRAMLPGGSFCKEAATE